MQSKKLIASLITASLACFLLSCSHKDSSSVLSSKDTINIDNGDDAPTIDPAMSQDNISSRVLYDLFEGLTSFDQENKTIPGLAEKWEITPDGKTYTFHLRSGLKFSDGSPITADDVVFSFIRLADPKVASPYNSLTSNIVNGQQIIDGKLSPDKLGVKALDKETVQISLVHPDSSFLAICSMPETGIVSKANLTKYKDAWTDPKNMVTSGAYKLKEWVLKGHMLLTKNHYYYAAKNVAISNVNFLPIVDQSASYSQYKSGQIDITYTLPVDQYKTIKSQYAQEEHTVPLEALYYYDFNMTLPKYKNSPQLRQALSMAVDREILVKDVLGQDQVPSYSFVTSSVENGKFADIKYPWASWPRQKQIAEAQALFKASGYGPNNPLKITISYNTYDGHKKVALAVASMWQQVFGTNSIQVTQGNQEWKTFLKARNMANYDIARDGWIADYNSVDNYLNLYQCNNPQDNSKYCNLQYNELMSQAQNASNPDERIRLIHQALEIAQNDYPIIPLYQYTYYRLVSPRVKGYNIEKNNLDHVMTKWFRLQ